MHDFSSMIREPRCSLNAGAGEGLGLHAAKLPEPHRIMDRDPALAHDGPYLIEVSMTCTIAARNSASGTAASPRPMAARRTELAHPSRQSDVQGGMI